MALNFKKIWEGLKLVAKTASTADSKGDLEVIDSTGKLQYHNGTSVSPVVTEAHSATLTNKSIDADNNPISNLEVDNLKSGVLNTDTSMTGATDSQVPSALAIKTYVDNGLSGQNEASEISFTPAGTISATNVQAAIQELDGDIQGHITDTSDAHDASAISVVPVGNLVATDAQAAFAELDSDIDLVGSDLGAHITDAVDAHDASAISNVPAGNIAATDVQSAINELDSEKQATITGAASTITTSNLTASRALASDGSGKVAVSATTSTELGYVSGVTSAIQTQLDAKVAASGGTLTSGSIVTPSRLDVKQDTAANLATYAATAADGQLAFGTDTGILYLIDNNTLVNVATGAAGDISAVSVSTTYSASSTDGIILANATTAGFTITLPTAVGIAGRIISITKTDSTTNSVTVDANSTETINGSLTYIINKQYDCIRLVSNGTNWNIISAYIPPKIATISDVKASGSDGGTATSGAFQTRTLNTLVDSLGIVTSLSANQFTLPAGTYYMEGYAVANQVNSHKCKIRNITDSTDAIIGSSSYTPSATANNSPTFFKGEVTITASKTFELQHRVSSTAATTGWGNGTAFGVSEVFAQVKITKVK